MWSLIRLVVSGDLHIEYIGAVLVDLGHNMELGEESILMSTMNSRFTGLRPEGCQELLMADNSLIKD